MRDRARCRIISIEITESSPQQHKQVRFSMVSLRTNLNQFDKISCRLCPQIVAADSGERVSQHNFSERVQIGFPASYDGNFSFKKQIQLSGERTFRSARAFGDCLNATERLCAPGNDQAGVAELSFAKKNCLCAFHNAKLAHSPSCRGACVKHLPYSAFDTNAATTQTHVILQLPILPAMITGGDKDHGTGADTRRR